MCPSSQISPPNPRGVSRHACLAAVSVALMGLGWCGQAAAEIYRYVDESGSVVFSDVPPPGVSATRMDIRSSPSAGKSAPATSGPTQTPAKPAVAKPVPTGEPMPPTAPPSTVSYDKLAIVSPKNDSIVRHNAGDVTVEVATNPALSTANGHRLQVYLDAKKMGQSQTSPKFTLTNVNRGSHVLEVEILDSQGRSVKRASSVTFHMQRASELQGGEGGGNGDGGGGGGNGGGGPTGGT